ncbi:hypothetical protein MYXA107069_31285 [Myxococcus xanthus]|uniref:hypothetical protein n=1 Tax=Myxococcus xanthus TaxID=34 RepID=UPI00223BA6EA|nr:hypothetical protein [Myxococcus xanthus]QZZ48611.1 hypothetical protein MyxoNM_05325 [Myxococcus xanthus]
MFDAVKGPWTMTVASRRGSADGGGMGMAADGMPRSSAGMAERELRTGGMGGGAGGPEGTCGAPSTSASSSSSSGGGGGTISDSSPPAPSRGASAAATS